MKKLLNYLDISSDKGDEENKDGSNCEEND